MEALRPEQISVSDLPVEFGRYTLEGVLGEGGMARVYRATLHGPAGFTKAVALKVVRSDALDEKARKQLISEARIGGLLNHVHVVNTFDLGEIHGALVIAMELVEGVSAHQLMKAHAPDRLHPGTAMQIARQACLGLSHAHELVAGGQPIHLVHRDLKPGNLMVSRDGVVKVADFGIALAQGITQGHEVAGTPAYMSPEQVRGEALGPSSDLFSMGSVIAKLIMGKSPFRRHVSAASVMAILEVERTLSRNRVLQKLDESAAGLGEVVGRCLRADPAERWPDARALGQALQEVLDLHGAGPALRDLVRDARGPAEEATASAPAAAPTVRLLEATNLVADEDRFVGRDAELKAISEAFDDHPLVTVTGAGGTGKTRLARAWALQNVARFQDGGGAWFVDLSDVHDLGDLLRAVSAVLHVEPDGDTLEQVSVALGRAIGANGPTLLILDNFEQLVGPGAQAVQAWIEAAPALKLLVTSRHRLEVPGESALVLEPLSTDDAVALFVARAEERAPGSIPKKQQKLVRTLAERLEGVPLALELAAAQLERTQLHRLLRRGSDGVLRSAIDWSWALLSPAEQDALAQVSTFVEGFSLDDAEAVLDLSNHLDAPWAVLEIESLVNKSLIRATPVPELPDTHRFSLYESIRRYAAEKLRTPDAVKAAHGAVCSGPDAMKAVQRRHVAYFAERAARIDMEALDRRAVEHRWLELGLDLGNLQAATDRALAVGDADAAAAAGRAASLVLERRGSLVASLRVVERVLQLDDVPDQTRLPLLLLQGRLLRRRGRLDEADEVLTSAGHLVRGSSHRLDRVDVLHQLGYLRVDQGRMQEAVSYLERALKQLEGTTDPRREGAVRALLASARSGSDLDGARVEVERAVRLLRTAGDPVAEGEAELVQTHILHRSGRSDDALKAGGAALDVYRSIGARRREGHARMAMAMVHGDLGRVVQAMDAYEQALALLRQTGDRTGEGAGLINLGLLHQEQGNLERARELYGEALGLFRERGAKFDEALVLGNLGEIEMIEENLGEARASLDRAVDAFRELGVEGFEGSYLAIRAHLRAMLGELDGATADLDRAGGLLTAEGDAHELGKLACRRGFVLHLAGDLTGALSALADADRAARSLGVGAGSDLALLVDDLRAALSGESW